MAEFFLKLFFVLGRISFILLILGLIIPDLVIWGKRRKTRKSVIKHYGRLTILSVIPKVFYNFLQQEGFFMTLHYFSIFFLFLGLIIGLINPDLVIWKNDQKTRKFVLRYYGLGLLLVNFLFTIVSITAKKSFYVALRGILSLSIIVSFLGLVVGLIKPDLVIRWSEEEKTRGKVIRYYGLGFLLSFFLFWIFSINLGLIGN